MDTQLKKLENPMLRGYLVSKAHKNKIPTAIPMFSGLTYLMAIIFTSPKLWQNYLHPCTYRFFIPKRNGISPCEYAHL